MTTFFAFDPGEKTGFCVCVDGKITETRTLSVEDILNFAKNYEVNFEGGWLPKPDFFVVEDWRIYPKFAARLTLQHLIGPQVIGMCRTWAHLLDIPVYLQTAGEVKGSKSKPGFYTDERLKFEGYWLKKTPHERDAIRHSLYAVRFKKYTGKKE